MSEIDNLVSSTLQQRIQSSFARQRAMQTIGATLGKVSSGEVHIGLPFSPGLTQQHGYIHAGIITTIVDSACGYAAYTLMPENMTVLSVEYKVNFLAPATGESFLAIGKVIKAGRTLTVCSGEVFACENGAEKLIVLMQATMMAVERRNHST